MKSQHAIFLFLTGLLCVASCAKAPAVVEYGEVCTDANKDKVVSVRGFVQVAEKVPCMNMFRPQRDCAVKLLDKVNVVGNEIIAYLPEGGGAGRIETPESSKPKAELKPTSVFARDQVKFRLGDGTIVVPQADVSTPVTITGKVGLTEDSSKRICTIMADSIEKAP